MIKFYLFVPLLLVSIILYAQRKKSIVPILKKHDVLLHASGLNLAQAAECEIVNYPVPASWTIVYYVAGINGAEGFVTGNNAYGDQEKAAYFDLSASSNTFLTKAWIAFAVANSNKIENLNKTVPIKVYDGTSGAPGNLLGTTNKVLSDLHLDAIRSSYSEITFPTAITLPPSKKVFVSIDLAGLSWDATNGYDSLAVYSNQISEAVSGENGFGWEKNNNFWATLNEDWGISLSLILHPLVSINSTCSSIVPITLTNFFGAHYENYNSLSWSTASEQGNKGFEVQKSIDNIHFESLGFIPTQAVDGNSTTTLNYIFKDNNPSAAKSYYRLKQVDINGRYTLSKTILINGSIPTKFKIRSVYPSPVLSTVNILVSSPTGHKLSLTITDIKGKVVFRNEVRPVIGDNKFSLNLNALSSGVYLIKVFSAKSGEVSSVRFLKQ